MAKLISSIKFFDRVSFPFRFQFILFIYLYDD